MRTRRGIVAGAPLADPAYSAAMVRVLKRVRLYLEKAGLVASIGLSVDVATLRHSAIV